MKLNKRGMPELFPCEASNDSISNEEGNSKIKFFLVIEEIALERGTWNHDIQIMKPLFVDTRGNTKMSQFKFIFEINFRIT